MNEPLLYVTVTPETRCATCGALTQYCRCEEVRPEWTGHRYAELTCRVPMLVAHLWGWIFR